MKSRFLIKVISFVVFATVSPLCGMKGSRKPYKIDNLVGSVIGNLNSLSYKFKDVSEEFTRKIVRKMFEEDGDLTVDGALSNFFVCIKTFERKCEKAFFTISEDSRFKSLSLSYEDKERIKEMFAENYLESIEGVLKGFLLEKKRDKAVESACRILRKKGLDIISCDIENMKALFQSNPLLTDEDLAINFSDQMAKDDKELLKGFIDRTKKLYRRLRGWEIPVNRAELERADKIFTTGPYFCPERRVLELLAEVDQKMGRDTSVKWTLALSKLGPKKESMEAPRAYIERDEYGDLKKALELSRMTQMDQMEPMAHMGRDEYSDLEEAIRRSLLDK